MKQAEDNKTRDLLAAPRGPYDKPRSTGYFGGMIAACRKRRHMTQSQYASALGVSLRSLIMAEKLTTRPDWPAEFPTVGKFALAEFTSWGEMCRCHTLFRGTGNLKCAIERKVDFVDSCTFGRGWPYRMTSGAAA